jgi:hypothetical protein
MLYDEEHVEYSTNTVQQYQYREVIVTSRRNEYSNHRQLAKVGQHTNRQYKELGSEKYRALIDQVHGPFQLSPSLQWGFQAVDSNRVTGMLPRSDEPLNCLMLRARWLMLC